MLTTVTVDKSILEMINKKANEMNYNRALKMEYIAALPDTTLFTLTQTMIHEHILGKKVAPHLRCMVAWSEEVIEKHLMATSKMEIPRIGYLDMHMTTAQVLFADERAATEPKTKFAAAFKRASRGGKR